MRHDAHSREGRLFVDLVDEVMRLNGRLVAAMKRNTQVAGLTPPQGIILSAIACAVEPPTVPRIGRALGHTRQSVQRIADDLVKMELVEWVPNPDHVRANRLVATAKGLETYKRIDGESAIWADRVVKHIDTTALKATVALLRQTRHQLEDDDRR